MMASRRGALSALAGLAAAGQARGAAAQGGWPDRPIRILVPFPPGAFNDGLARLVADQMPARLGQVGVVDNRAGAGGSVGTGAIARSVPDGYTIGIANTATLVFNHFLYPNAGLDVTRDLAPLAVCARLANVLVVSPSLNVRTLQELLALARSRPGALSYASSGNGSSPHLAAELLRARTGISIVHVPYRGSAPAVNDMLAGAVPLMFDNVPNVLAHIQAGTMRALAVTGSSRDPVLPEVPTLQEAGVPDYEMYVWFGLVAPAGLPATVQQRLSAELIGTVTATDTAERIRRLGAEVWTRDSAQFAALLALELAKWGPVVRASGARAD